MPLKFSVEVVGAADQRRRLQGVQERLDAGMTANGAGSALLAVLADVNRERWETDGFGTWPLLSEATLRRRIVYRVGGAHGNRHHYANRPSPLVGEDGPPLHWTGALEESLSDPTGAGAPNAAVSMKRNQLTLGTRLSYANFLTPRFDLSGLRPQDERRLVDVFERYVIADGEE